MALYKVALEANWGSQVDFDQFAETLRALLTKQPPPPAALAAAGISQPLRMCWMHVRDICRVAEAACKSGGELHVLDACSKRTAHRCV